MLDVGPSGKVAKEIRLLPEGTDGGHLYMRNARRLANGHTLVAHYGDQVVREYDGDGRKVREIPAASGPHSVVRLPNGHTLIACGDVVKDGGHVFEVDAGGRTVWEIKSGDLPGISLKCMTGLQRLPNGHTVLSNWQGHGQFGSGPHILEVTRDKKVVWTFEPSDDEDDLQCPAPRRAGRRDTGGSLALTLSGRRQRVRVTGRCMGLGGGGLPITRRQFCFRRLSSPSGFERVAHRSRLLAAGVCYRAGGRRPFRAGCVPRDILGNSAPLFHHGPVHLGL